MEYLPELLEFIAAGKLDAIQVIKDLAARNPKTLEKLVENDYFDLFWPNDEV